MMLKTLLAACALLFATACTPVAQQPTEDSLRVALAAFDATTQVDGGGPDAYAALLHPDFTFWSAPGGVTSREDLVSGLREWWDSGNRVGVDNTSIVDAAIVGNIAVVRLDTHESFVDLAGAPTGEFGGYAVQTWLYDQGAWRLLSSTVWAAAPE